MNHTAVVYDETQVYGEKLAQYLNAKDNFPFEVRAFYSEDELALFCHNCEAEILIVDEKYVNKTKELSFIERFVLSGEKTSAKDDYYSVYKYQEVDKIIREIMNYLSDSVDMGPILKRKKTMKIISFYSPVKRTMSTTMAIGMGQVLSKNHKTLYINLECYSGLGKLLDREFEKDLTDLIYYLESNGKNIALILSGIVETFEGVDILPPVNNQSDLIAMEKDKWLELIRHIEYDTDYEYVIIDFGDAIQGLYDLLSYSEYVVTCTDDDEFCANKLKQYEESLCVSGYNNILEKTIKCSIPQKLRKNVDIHHLIKGELGGYIKKTLIGIVNE